jgi:hypothetical protein
MKEKIIVVAKYDHYVETIARITKTQIVLDNNSKYRISDGNVVGGDNWCTGRIMQYSEEQEQQINENKIRQTIINKLEQITFSNLSTDQLKEVYKIIQPKK